MRTTLDIENDVLAAARELARQQNVAVGTVISRLVREALSGNRQAGEDAPPSVTGFRPFPSRGSIVTNYQVDALRDEEGL